LENDVAQATLKIPPGAGADDIALLQAIKAGQDENDVEISLALNALNKGVAQLVAKNGKIIVKLQGDVLQSLNRHYVDNDNAIDGVSTAILSATQNAMDDSRLLLTQLAASAGLTQPGDPLEAALTQRVAEQPDLAYSATLLLALKDAMPCLCRIADACERIADALEGSALPAPLPVMGEPGAGGGALPGEPVEAGSPIDALPVDDVSLDDSPLPPDDSEGSESAR
jgi:hypothetical protein